MRKICILLGLVACVSTTMADVIILNNGNRIEGQLIAEDEFGYVMRNALGELTLPSSKVSKFTKEPLDKSYEEIGDQFFVRKEYAKAITYYENGLKVNSINFTLKDKLAKTKNLFIEKQSSTSIEQIKDIRTKLASYPNYTKNEEFADLMTFINAQLEDQELNPAVKKEIETKLPDIYYRYGLYLTDHMNLYLAIDYFQKTLEKEPDHVDAQKHLAELYENDPANIFKCINMNADLYDKTLDSRYLKKVVKFSDSYNILLDKFKYVKKYYELNPKDKVARDMYKKTLNLSLDAFKSKKNFQAMEKVYKELEGLGQKVDPKNYEVIEFYAKIRDVDTRDIESVLEPSAYARKKNLLDEGFNYIRKLYMRNRSNADIQKEYYLYADLNFQKIQKMFGPGNYQTCINDCLQIAEYFPEYEKAQQVISLRTKAELELEREKLEKQEEAKNLARRAREYFQRGLSYIQQLKNSNYESTSLDNAFQEAMTHMNRARKYCYDALEIDPTLRQPENEDLGTLLSDINLKIRELKNRQRTPYRPIIIQNRTTDSTDYDSSYSED